MKRTPLEDTSVWIFKWLMGLGLIAIGWSVGRLESASLLFIIIFGIWQGFLPHLSYSRDLGTAESDREKERRALQHASVGQLYELIDRSPEQLGEVMTAVTMVHQTRDRDERQRLKDRAIADGKAKWEARLEPVETASELSTGLGLLGSLIGIWVALQELGIGAANGQQGLFAAMSTMSSTTVAGIAMCFLLTGLAAKGRTALETHITELDLLVELIISRLYDRDPEDDSDNDPDASLL